MSVGPPPVIVQAISTSPACVYRTSDSSTLLIVPCAPGLPLAREDRPALGTIVLGRRPKPTSEPSDVNGHLILYGSRRGGCPRTMTMSRGIHRLTAGPQ